MDRPGGKEDQAGVNLMIRTEAWLTGRVFAESQLALSLSRADG
jgi:hypothetical protein